MKKTGVMQNVVRSLAAVFDAEAQSPARKAGKLEEGGAASAADNPTSKKGPFDKEQKAWLKSALYQAMEAFGENIDERVEHVEQAVTQVQEEVAEIKNRGVDKAEVEELRARLSKLEAAAAAPTSPAGSASSPGSRSSYGGAPAIGPRTVALLGGLGWDVDELQLIVNAKKVLNEQGVDETTYGAVSPACRHGGQGSMVEVKFVSHEALLEARMRVRNYEEKFERAKTGPWLDVKKTHEERRPTRALRTGFEILCDSGQKEGIEKSDMTIQVQYRAISIRCVKVLYLDRDGDVIWTAAGESLVSEPTRELVARVVAGVS